MEDWNAYIGAEEREEGIIAYPWANITLSDLAQIGQDDGVDRAEVDGDRQEVRIYLKG